MNKITEEEKKYLDKQKKDYEKSLKNFEIASNPDEIYEALKKNKFIFSENTSRAKKVLKKITTNNHPKVKLGIAKFFGDSEILEKIYFETTDEEVKKLCLERDLFSPLWHGLFEPEKKFYKFLVNAKDEELYLYFTNKNFKLMYIENILKKEWPYNKISVSLYRNIILILEDNINTKNAPDSLSEKYSNNGYGWYTDDKTFNNYHEKLTMIKKLRNLE